MKGDTLHIPSKWGIHECLTYIESTKRGNECVAWAAYLREEHLLKRFRRSG